LHVLLIPYNGFAIGTFISDAIREIYGHADVLAFRERETPDDGVLEYSIREGYWWIAQDAIPGGRDVATGPLFITTNNTVPTANENRSVSIACLTCMSY